MSSTSDTIRNSQAGASSTAPSLELKRCLSYELLLRKSCDAENAVWNASDDASTTEPASSASTGGSDSVPPRDQVCLLRNVAAHEQHGDEKLSGLISQTRELSVSIFGEDCLLEVTKRSGWKLSLLVSDDRTVLCGYIVAKVTRGSLSIAKIAVPEHFRGQGFGKLIMEEVMKAAKKQGDVYDVCLSSLPGAVKFYQRMGFKAFRGLKMSSEDLVEGQVYMEKRLRQRRR